jgi:hypothetical protein
MKQSIDAAMGAAMESIAANEAISARVGGKLGKMARSGLVAGAFICAGMMATGAAQAANNAINGGCALGGIAGALLGNQIGGGNGQKVAIAAGGILGCKAGQEVQANSEYRQQRQAGYPSARGRQMEQPSRYDNGRPQRQGYGGGQGQDDGHGQPVVGPAPMQSYMASAFAQIEGRVQPTQDLTTQGRMAMDKALAEAERRMDENLDAQQAYAGAYAHQQNARRASMNPEAQTLLGNRTVQAATYESEKQLNQAAKQRAQANMNFGSAGARMADLAEYEAAQGYDIRPYADRIERVLAAPMSAPVTGISPATRQPVTFVTPGTPQRQPNSLF